MGLSYLKPPVVWWKDKNLPVEIIVSLECDNHPLVSGNKWWKLKYNLDAALASGLPVLTFGGAFSNHIFATSAACHALGLQSIGIIRGERVNNPTLSFASQNGMKLEFISREMYKQKAAPGFIETLRERFGDFFLIPEGGTNELAVRGCREWGETLLREIEFDKLCIAVGTGGTIAGLISAMSIEKSVIGFSSLKGGSFQEADVRRWLPQTTCDWHIETSYHFGGYAKTDSKLSEFIDSVRREQGIMLDHVYTAKMMYGVLDLVRQGFIREGSKVLTIHTGGLQGMPCRVV
jgi:1-aminocyclopropane-1-carboxylate deaminase